VRVDVSNARRLGGYSRHQNGTSAETGGQQQNEIHNETPRVHRDPS